VFERLAARIPAWQSAVIELLKLARLDQDHLIAVHATVDAAAATALAAERNECHVEANALMRMRARLHFAAYTLLDTLQARHPSDYPLIVGIADDLKRRAEERQKEAKKNAEKTAVLFNELTRVQVQVQLQLLAVMEEMKGTLGAGNVLRQLTNAITAVRATPGADLANMLNAAAKETTLLKATERAKSWSRLRTPAATQFSVAKGARDTARMACADAKDKLSVVTFLHAAASLATTMETAKTVLAQLDIAASNVQDHLQKAQTAARAATEAANQSTCVDLINSMKKDAETQAKQAQDLASEADALARKAEQAEALASEAARQRQPYALWRRVRGKRSRYLLAKVAAESVLGELDHIQPHLATLQLELIKAMIVAGSAKDDACKAATAVQKHVCAAKKSLLKANRLLGQVMGLGRRTMRFSALRPQLIRADCLSLIVDRIPSFISSPYRHETTMPSSTGSMLGLFGLPLLCHYF